jgi:hypothetical protein
MILTVQCIVRDSCKVGSQLSMCVVQVTPLYSCLHCYVLITYHRGLSILVILICNESETKYNIVVKIRVLCKCLNIVCFYKQPMGALQRWKAAAIGSHSRDARKVLQSAAVAAAAAAASSKHTATSAADGNSSSDSKHTVTERELVAQVLSALQATSLRTRTRSTTDADSNDNTEHYRKAVTGVTVHVLRADGTHELYTEQQLIDVLKSSEHRGGDHAAAAT